MWFVCARCCRPLCCSCCGNPRHLLKCNDVCMLHPCVPCAASKFQFLANQHTNGDCNTYGLRVIPGRRAAYGWLKCAQEAGWRAERQLISLSDSSTTLMGSHVAAKGSGQLTCLHTYLTCVCAQLLALHSLQLLHQPEDPACGATSPSMSRKPAVPDLFGDSDDEDHPKHRRSGAGHNTNTG